MRVFAEHRPEGRPEPPFGTTFLWLLHCCVDVVEGRDDCLKRLNPRRSIDRFRQGLQHFWVGVGVVVVCIVLVFPQTDRNHICRATTAQGDFFLEALLLLQQWKNLVFEGVGVIGLHVGFDFERDITCVQIQPPKGCLAYKVGETSDGLTYFQGT